ncbi:MAG: 2-amino-4-hydroxy-6-hydroxymethyldihydropteridine diphosphokinase [Moraxellaceae bacterium]
MSPRFPAYIGLGANLGDAQATLKAAVKALRALPDSQLTGLSRLYRSAPVGPAGQPDYFNAAARFETSLAPHALLAALQAIENDHGRLREVRWGARTLDLDLLLYDRDEISTADLVLPHPELSARNFVLHPLLDIDATLALPDGRMLASLPAAKDESGLMAMADSHWAD